MLKKVLLGIIITIAIAFVIVNVISRWNIGLKPITLDVAEEAEIRKVSFDSANNDTLLLDVQSKDAQTIIFNAAIIKDPEHRTVTTIVPFQSELPAHKNTTIAINLKDINLASGNYTVNLWTTKSRNFYSPLFAVP